MKILILTLLLLLAICALCSGDVAARRVPTTAATTWPANSTVRVYFVRGLFTSEQTEALLRTLEAWNRRPNRGISDVRFVQAGETHGLMDCLGCLTVSRQEACFTKSKRASINPLRRHESGQLISAWIAFDNSVTNPRALSGLMFEALERGPGGR